MNEHIAVCSNGNVFGSQGAMQEVEMFSIRLEYLADNVRTAFFTERICLFLISCIVILFDSIINFMLSNTIKNQARKTGIRRVFLLSLMWIEPLES